MTVSVSAKGEGERMSQLVLRISTCINVWKIFAHSGAITREKEKNGPVYRARLKTFIHERDTLNS